MYPEVNMNYRDGPLLGYRGAVVSILIMAIIAVKVPRYLILLCDLQGSALPGAILCVQVFMAGFPFFLIKITPTLAGFDRQWLPSDWSQWLWFPGMLLVLFLVAGLHNWLLPFFHKDWLLFSKLWPVGTTVAPVTVVFHGVVCILFGPIAEELFWRGYLLPQLEKVTRWPIAISLHSLLFSLAHIPAYWPVLLATFFSGIVLGIWRIRFRSILPLVLAHMILNGVALGPRFKAQYEAAVQSYPKHHKVEVLTREPAEKAVPALIAIMADRDELVSMHALQTLGENYRTEAEPYFAEALTSNDNYIVNRALFAIEWYGYSDLKPQVRAIAWSHESLRIRLAAVSTLCGIGDEAGLTEIARKHPEEKVRNLARDWLRELRDER